MFSRKARALSPKPRRAPRLLSLCALLLLLAAAPSRAQVGGTDHSGTGGNHSIQGRLIFASGQRVDIRLKVKLESSGYGDLSLFSDGNGNFRFSSLRAGSYTVVVDGGDEFETVRETVLIEPGNVTTRRGVLGAPVSRPMNVQIYLRPKRQQNLPQPGVLNAALASVPKNAAELYQKGMEQARKGDNRRALDLIRLAVEAHPNFPLALSEMGVLYLKLKQPEKAAESLRAALKLTPEHPASLLAYGRVLLDLQRLSESEEQFRKVLKGNSASPWAHFYLGVILLKRREHEEAEAAFKSALSSGGDHLALAHYYLGGLYWSKQQYRQAADELEAYLRLMPGAPDAARLRQTIKEFRAKK
jgi:Tfp pilus assembly protein PilF